MTTDTLTFAEKVARADRLFHGEFYRCAVSNRVLECADPGDDKVICHCRSAKRTGNTHWKHGLKKATAEEYVRQHEEDCQ